MKSDHRAGWLALVLCCTASILLAAPVPEPKLTGIVKVKRVVVVQDCGIVMDKLTAESQVNGGVVGSLNFALYEDRILDRNTGQMVNLGWNEWTLWAGTFDSLVEHGTTGEYGPL